NPHDAEERPAGGLLLHRRVLQPAVDVDVEDAGGVLRPLHVAAHAVERLRDAAQHGGPCCCCCWAAWGTDGPGSRGLPGSGGCRMVVGSRRGRLARGPPGSASTHVSFDPPPWLELTTRLPSGRATRVRPPGTTHTRSPSLTANGRRSTWRGRRWDPTWVGDVDSCTTSWAIQPRGLSSRSSRRASSWAPVAVGPMTRP